MAIVVVNKSDQEFADRFNGCDYVFPVGKKVLVDEEVARHIFGFGADDKTPYLARLGWIRSNGDYPAAMELLGKFSFSSFDPYAQLDEARPEGQQAQQLSPVAPGESGESDSDGPAEADSPTPPPPPATTSGGIMSRLQGLMA